MAKKTEKPVDLSGFPSMTDEALKQFAADNGVELKEGVDREGVIKAINDYFTPATSENGEGNGGQKPLADPPAKQPENGDGKGVVIKSVKRAGKTTTAVTGKPIIFDKDGIATVDPKDAEYLAGIPGIEKV
jgi:hypothetical protein